MNKLKVAIIMGSQSDWPVMKYATSILDELEIPYDAMVVSAHRTPARLYEFAQTAEDTYNVVIAGAGGAAHLPGMAAALTWLPVIGVPVSSKNLKGMDSLLSIVQMPKGVAVATQSIGESGAFNAGLMAAQIIATSNENVRSRLKTWREEQTEQVPWEVE
ncbi:5-(carboxyamino)imidazole ribonucleotide mutase [Colwelliaceae bacterium 6471]